MKAYVLHGINDIKFEDAPVPVPRENEVLVKVRAAGVCGSDIPRIYKNGAHVHPIIPGHEFAGEVVDAGSFDNSDLVGKRVGIFPLIPCQQCDQCFKKNYEMCRKYDYLGSRSDGAFAEFVRVPVWNLIELPDSVPFEHAAMLEPFSVAAHSMRAMIDDSTPKDTPILVWGVGTIGLMLVMLLKSEGFSDINCVASKAYQADTLIQKIGIDSSKVFLASKDQNDGSEDIKSVIGKKGISLSFECVGKNETINAVVECTSPSGKIMFVGNPASDITFDRNVYWKILRSQLTIKGTWNSSFTKEENDDWHYVLNKLSKGELQADTLISHKFDLENLIKGFELMRDKSENYIKCMFVS